MTLLSLPSFPSSKSSLPVPSLLTDPASSRSPNLAFFLSVGLVLAVVVRSRFVLDEAAGVLATAQVKKGSLGPGGVTVSLIGTSVAEGPGGERTGVGEGVPKRESLSSAILYESLVSDASC